MRKEAHGIGRPHQGWQGDLPRTGEGESQARSPEAVKTRLGRTTRVRVFSLPARDHCGGSDPEKGRLTVNCEVKRLTLPDAALAVRKQGRSLHLLPSRAARRRDGREGDARGVASLHLVASDTENPCCPVSDAVIGESPRPRRRGLRPLRERRCGCGNHETAE